VRGHETLLVRVEQATDDFGDPIPPAPTPYEVAGCVVYPRTTSESDFRSDTVVEGLIALLPVKADTLHSTDQVSYRGRWYDIDGAIGQWTYLSGQNAGAQIQLKRVTG